MPLDIINFFFLAPKGLKKLARGFNPWYKQNINVSPEGAIQNDKTYLAPSGLNIGVRLIPGVKTPGYLIWQLRSQKKIIQILKILTSLLALSLGLACSPQNNLPVKRSPSVKSQASQAKIPKKTIIKKTKTIRPQKTRAKPEQAKPPVVKKEAPLLVVKKETPAPTEKKPAPKQVKSWSMFLGNPGRTSYLDTKPMLKKPDVLWKTSAPGFAPIAGNGYIYLMSRDSVRAYSAQKGGKALWKSKGEFLGMRQSAPTLYKGKLYVPGKSALSILDAKTGHRLLQLSPDGPKPYFQEKSWYTTSPILVDDKLYFGKWRMLFGYDIKKNSYLWQYPDIETAKKGTEVLPHLTYWKGKNEGSRILAGFCPILSKEEISNKVTPWFRKKEESLFLTIQARPKRANFLEDRKITLPAFASVPASIWKDKVLISTGFKGFGLYDLSSGKKEWYLKQKMNLRGCAVSITPGGIAVQGGLVCHIIDLNEKGKTLVDLKKLTENPEDTITTAPLILQNHFYYLDKQGKLNCRKLITGKRIWQISLGREGVDMHKSVYSPLCFYDGKIYLADGKTLYCVGEEIVNNGGFKF